MTRLRLTAAVLASLAVLGAAPAAPAFTRSEISVAPQVARLDTAAGKTVEETITVVNLSSQDYHLTATPTDLDAGRDGAFVSRPTGTVERSAAAWATVEPASFDIRAGRTSTVKVSLSTPDGTAAGGYTAAVRFEATAEGGRVAGSLHALLVDVAGAGTRTESRLVDVSIPEWSFGSTVPVTMTFENSGTTHVAAQGDLIVRDGLSRITARAPIPKTFILPGHVRDLKMEVPAPVVPGRISVDVHATVGAKAATGNTTARGYALTWWSVGLIAAVALIILRVIFGIARRIVRRRRRRRTVSEDSGPDAPLTRRPSVWADAEEPVAPRSAAPLRSVASPKQEPTDRDVPDPDVPGPYRELEQLRPPFQDFKDLAEAVGAVGDDDLDDADPGRDGPSAFAPRRSDPVVVSSRSRPKIIGGVVEADVEDADDGEPRPGRDAGGEASGDRVAVWPRAVKSTQEPTREPPPPPALASAVESVAALLERAHQGLWSGTDGELSSAAAVRRGGVALGLLAEGAGQSGARIDVGLDVLRSVREEAEVGRLAEEVYARAERSAGDDVLAPLALGLAVLGSERAPEALLRAYRSAPPALADQLLDALRACDPDALRAHASLLQALPKERRRALRSA